MASQVAVASQAAVAWAKVVWVVPRVEEAGTAAN